MKNSKISDRQLAKLLGVSQPTVTRRRARLEKEVIDGYTTIPKWEKIGYEIASFCFFKCRYVSTSAEQHDMAHKKCVEWMEKHSNILWAGKGVGMGSNCFMVAFHRKFHDYTTFVSEMQSSDTGYAVADKQSFIVSIPELNAMKPFHLKYLADAIALSFMHQDL